MRHESSRVRQGLSALAFAALAIVSVAPSWVGAAQVLFVGNVDYATSGNTVMLTADKIQNFDSGGFSTDMRMELWALNAPYSGGQFDGFPLATYGIAPLAGGASVTNVNSGAVPFVMPPPGTWTFVMFLTEYSGAPFDNGYVVRDSRNFPTPIVVPSLPPSVTPQIGTWWNPDESGSGYAIDYQHGVLVVTIYSYQTDGAPQWYLASGPLSGDTFTAFLTKYVSGQCISCAYSGRPTTAGDDGTVTIVFSSATTATMFLPGGRTTQIQRTVF